jgi:hypothetical protein
MAQTKFIYILTRGILTMAGIPKQGDKRGIFPQASDP